MSDFVTIATYDDYLSANRDLDRLEENGIMGYLADENTITMQWLYKNALGGIKLRVVGDDAERAKAILSEKPEGIEPTPIDYKIESVGAELICPNCGSNNTVTEAFSKIGLGISWMILGFPLPIKLKNKHRCFYCDHQWETSNW